jgi:Zn-dependent protease
MPTRQGSFHLFRLAGVNLYLHWSWFLVAMFEISQRRGNYSSFAFNVLEYLGLFAIVLMHEMGHALACRSVGGKADEIVLWPLGGVAYVAPPQRPGAMLWSIAAGPLVNVALFFVLGFGLIVANGSIWVDSTAPDLVKFLGALFLTNGVLLAFNLLPIYPLDGGQIVRSLLWFVLGRAKSLMVSVIIGFVGLPLWFIFAWWQQSFWFAILGVFILVNCWRGLQHAKALAQAAKLPRRDGFQCPSCKAPPPIGGWWTCGRCGKSFDIFETQSICPHCGAQFAAVRCLDCGEDRPINEWLIHPPSVR